MTAIIQLLRPERLVRCRGEGPLCRKQKEPVSAFLRDVGDVKGGIKENEILQGGKVKAGVACAFGTAAGAGCLKRGPP